jgi:hypothetical protein
MAMNYVHKKFRAGVEFLVIGVEFWQVLTR